MSNALRHKYQLLATSDEKANDNEKIELYDIKLKQSNVNSDLTNSNFSTSRSPCKSLLGLSCAFLSCCFFATGSVFTKLCKGYLNAFQIVLTRSFVQLFFSIPLITIFRYVKYVF